MSSPQIRPAQPSDAAALAEFGERIFRETFAPDNRPEDLDAYLASAFSPEIQGREIVDPELETLVIEHEARLIGYAQLKSAEPDVAVGAAGSSTWERCCLALPTVMVVLADNQRQIAANVAAAGAAIVAEPSTPASIATMAATLLADDVGRRNMASAAAAVCDGLGAARVADAILTAVAAARRIG